MYAADILRVELQGNSRQADSLRKIYFADRRAPTWTDDKAALEGARANLAAWLLEESLTNWQRGALRGLRDELEKRAATDPTSALTFLARLPLYGDRLLDAGGNQQPRK
jgi:hypothetical protein